MSQIVHILTQNSRRSPWYAFFAGWGLYVLSMLLFLVLVPSLLALLFGFSATEMQAITGGQAEISDAGMWMLRLFQGSNQLLTWGLVGAFMVFLMGYLPEELAAARRPEGYAAGLAMLTMLLSLPLVAFLTLSPDAFELPAFLAGLESWMRDMEEVSQGMLERMLHGNLLVLAGNIVTLALIPAVCEELFFRGFLQRNMARMMGPHTAVWLTAAIFSLVHLQFYGFFARLLLGGLLGYFFYGSRSLIPAVAAHFIFNLSSVLLASAAFNTSWIDPEMVRSDSYELPWGLVVVSALAVTGLTFHYLQRAPQVSRGLS